MSVDISYMGTKRDLAPTIAETISRARPGPFLDAFSGMCSVALAVSPSRQILCNDIQQFASEAATAVFMSQEGPPTPGSLRRLLLKKYHTNYGRLQTFFGKWVESEAKALRENDNTLILEHVELYRDHWGSPAVKELWASCVADKAGRLASLFSTTYAEGYFGIRQCMQIDSIVFAVDCSLRDGRVSSDDARWLRVALGRAILRVSTTTGHFAQFLKPTPKTAERFMRQRRRDVWAEFAMSCDGLSPAGSKSWRRGNKVFNQESLDLLNQWPLKKKPSVVYADPPYTRDQYSRFYHVLETLIKYDYPIVSSNGRYRGDRYQAPFCHKGGVADSLELLATGCSNLGSELVMSYPLDGIGAGMDLRATLADRFRTVSRLEIPRRHSTMGASKGTAKHDATEVVYWAKP